MIESSSVLFIFMLNGVYLQTCIHFSLYSTLLSIPLLIVCMQGCEAREAPLLLFAGGLVPLEMLK